MAESKGFEPLIGINLYTLSRRAPSTTRTALLLLLQFRPFVNCVTILGSEHAACSLFGLSMPSPFGLPLVALICSRQQINHSDSYHFHFSLFTFTFNFLLYFLLSTFHSLLYILLFTLLSTFHFTFLLTVNISLNCKVLNVK